MLSLPLVPDQEAAPRASTAGVASCGFSGGIMARRGLGGRPAHPRTAPAERSRRRRAAPTRPSAGLRVAPRSLGRRRCPKAQPPGTGGGAPPPSQELVLAVCLRFEAVPSACRLAVGCKPCPLRLLTIRRFVASPLCPSHALRTTSCSIPQSRLQGVQAPAPSFRAPLPHRVPGPRRSALAGVGEKRQAAAAAAAEEGAVIVHQSSCAATRARV